MLGNKPRKNCLIVPVLPMYKRPLSAICAQSSTIVHLCGLFGSLSKGNIRHKMTTIVGNRGQLWTSTLSPHLLSPRLDFPDHCHKRDALFQEDVNGEKLTVKKWWIFGADFFTVWCRFFTVYADFSRFIRDINGEKKHLVIDDLFHG